MPRPDLNEMPKRKLPANVTKDDVYQQLDKILNSTALRRSARLGDFLKYVVSALLEEDTIKEYHIGVEVFGRKSSFDPRLDPIVRVEACRLRSRIKQYLETEGQDDWLVIQLPKGGYMPTIELSGLHSDRVVEGEFLSTGDVSNGTRQVGVALLPLLNLVSGPASELLCDSMTEELIDMLTNVDGFCVAPRVSVIQFKHQAADARTIGRRLGVNFLLEGSVRRWEGRLLVKMRIIHAGTGFSSRLGSFEAELGDWITTQQEICEAIASQLKMRLLGERANPKTNPLQDDCNCVA